MEPSAVLTRASDSCAFEHVDWSAVTSATSVVLLRSNPFPPLNNPFGRTEDQNDSHQSLFAAATDSGFVSALATPAALSAIIAIANLFIRAP